MLKDAQRAVDDLAAICKAVMLPGAPLVGVSDGTRTFIARTTAARVIADLAAAASRGVDVGAEVARQLASHTKDPE